MIPLPARRLAAVTGLVAWFALALQAALSVALSLDRGRSLAEAVLHYLGYFTILTNLLGALALTAGASRAPSWLGERLRHPAAIHAIATLLLLVGVAYSLLLMHLWEPTGWQLLADVLLHHALPLAFLGYWALAVPRGAVRLRELAPWVAWPAAYFVLHTVRGRLSGVYPYPFLDDSVLGLGRALLHGVGLLAACSVAAAALAWSKRARIAG